MPRRKRIPIPCANEECGQMFKPHRASSRYCSVDCRRAVDARVCRNGHDLTLPGASRPQKGGKAMKCVECEREAGERYRRRIGKKARGAWLESARKTPEQRRETKRKNAERARRRAGVKPRTVVNAAMHVKRELPTELSRAWGRAGHYSQMRRKFPTRESLVAAYQRGELPMFSK